MAGNWSSAYEAQMDLWRFWRSDVGRRYATGYASSIQRKQEGYGVQYDHELNELVTMITNQERVMFEAEPIFVERDMVTMVEQAMRSFQPEPLRAPDLVVPAGFVQLERAVHLIDVNGKDFPIRALAWMPAIVRVQGGGTVIGTEMEGIVVSAYLHWDDDTDREWKEDGMSRGFAQQMLAYGPLQLVHVMPWPFGVDFAEAAKQNPDAIDLESPSTEAALGTHRLMQTLWRLMAQTIAVKVQAKPQRPTLKRARKFKFSDTKYVTVVTLRRPKPEYGKDHVARDVEWDHRWLVAGHWRNQWYPAEKMHRQIWINPYVKGPDDKPLIIRELRAFEFRR